MTALVCSVERLQRIFAARADRTLDVRTVDASIQELSRVGQRVTANLEQAFTEETEAPAA